MAIMALCRLCAVAALFSSQVFADASVSQSTDNETCMAEGHPSCGGPASTPRIGKENVLLQRDYRGGHAHAAHHRGMAASCCEGCSGYGFCSPRSGICYYRKEKTYFQSCSSGAAALKMVAVGDFASEAASCCDGCSGYGFCSPQSGNCYDSKAKDYYQSCSSGGKSCCESCTGHSFCSPRSGSCYDYKLKEYYATCAEDGGLSPPSPPPTPGEGGLVPPPAPPAIGCCNACDNFCSPLSGTCYDEKSKAYYMSCNGKEVLEYKRLVWFDEFNDTSGTVDSTKWRYMNGDNPNNRELQFYTDRRDNSVVEEGSLKIIAKCEEYAARRRFYYTSARIVTEGRADWGPGHRIEVRAKVPNSRGAWPAIWMMPAKSVYGDWPNSGEIDIMESVGCTKGSVYGTIHTGAYNHMKNTQQGRSFSTDETGWHVYAIEWEESYIHWYIDEHHYNTFAPDDISNSAKWPFNQNFYLILNVAVGGTWGGFCLGGGPSCSEGSGFNRGQVMEFDYVRVYARSNSLAQLPQTGHSQASRHWGVSNATKDFREAVA